MVERARKKAAASTLSIDFREGDAHSLPFADQSFDVVICECTLCALHIERALREMHRVLRAGGYVGMHDLAWRESAPQGEALAG